MIEVAWGGVLNSYAGTFTYSVRVTAQTDQASTKTRKDTWLEQIQRNLETYTKDTHTHSLCT